MEILRQLDAEEGAIQTSTFTLLTSANGRDNNRKGTQRKTEETDIRGSNGIWPQKDKENARGFQRREEDRESPLTVPIVR